MYTSIQQEHNQNDKSDSHNVTKELKKKSYSFELFIHQRNQKKLLKLPQKY